MWSSTLVLELDDIVAAIVGIHEMALRASTHGTQMLFGPDHGKGRMTTDSRKLKRGYRSAGSAA
jgi:hypothetical protein